MKSVLFAGRLKWSLLILLMMCALTAALLCSCSRGDGSGEAERSAAGETVKTGIIAGQILDGADGEIHYSYYIPEDYDENRMYPLMVTMPGYDMMWFGEDSSGANLSWDGFRVWTEQDEDMIVVSAQLTDWGETSARQAVELTEHFIESLKDTAKVL